MHSLHQQFKFSNKQVGSMSACWSAIEISNDRTPGNYLAGFEDGIGLA